MDNKEILGALPDRLKNPITTALKNNNGINEIRIRALKPIMLLKANENFFVSDNGMLGKNLMSNALVPLYPEIIEIFQRLCHYSVYSYEQSLNSGFVTLRGGNRVGIASSAVIKDGKISAVKEISSFNFRIARSIPSCADEILNLIYQKELLSTLIIGAPSSGKTTVLRELCRKISSGYNGEFLKCTVIDERDEIASMNCGIPLLDVGVNADVLSAFPKDKGTIIALRTLSPDVILLDEIGTFSEAESIKEGLNSGVKFIASAHASSFEEACERPQIQALLESGAFKCMVLLGNKKNLGKTEDFKML